MSLEHRLQAWNLFERYLELDEAGRAALLRDECGGDEGLRREMERLLECDQRVAERGFLANSPLAIRFLPDGDDLLGRDIGPYRLEQLIGEGGMGCVYRAVRSTDFQQTAAVKIIRAGRGDAKLVRAFQNEVQLLAKVRQHPRIVGLMDAGMTPDGYAYLVMDYVPGLPLDEYCRRRGLTWRQRLHLFLQVCDAVAFAHRQLVTHRDLKPRNILVLEGGEAKLLDFGIAREESFGDESTRTVVRACTPDYASPEQVRGETLSTLTDVYSLGVILFELLTGRRPYETAQLSPAEIERRVCDSDPPPLTGLPFSASGSKVRDATNRGEKTSDANTSGEKTSVEQLGCELPARDVVRDLDAIILKAMAKQPEQRYGTVTALSDDIERVLRGDAVLARKRTTSYVVRKFLRRHRILVATISVVLASLVVGLIGVGLGFREARREQARTAASLALNRETVRQFMELIERRQIGRMPGSQAARLELQQVLQTAADALQRDFAHDDASQEQLAGVDLRVGQSLLALGERERALDFLQRASAAYGSLLDSRPTDGALRKALGDCWQGVGAVHRERLERDQCESAIAKALGHYQAIQTPELADAAKIGQGASQLILGRLAFERRDIALANDSYRQAEALFREVQQRRPDDLLVAEKLLQVDNDLCATEYSLGEFPKAEARGRAGLPQAERLARQNPLIVDYQVLLARRQLLLANALNEQDKFAEALFLYEQSDGRWALIVEQNPDVVSYQSEWAVVLRAAGTACQFAKEVDKAIPYFLRSAKLREQVAAVVTDQPKTRDELARAYRSLGEAFDEARRFDDALAQFDKADAIQRALAKEFPTNATFLGACGHTQHVRGMALKGMGRAADAVPVYQQGIAWCRQAAQHSAGFSQNARVLFNLHLGLIAIHRDALDGAALRAALLAAEESFPDASPFRVGIGGQWAISALVKGPSGDPLMPDAAEHGRKLLAQVRKDGVDLSDLKDWSEWPDINQLPGYRELFEGTAPASPRP